MNNLDSSNREYLTNSDYKTKENSDDSKKNEIQ